MLFKNKYWINNFMLFFKWCVLRMVRLPGRVCSFTSRIQIQSNWGQNNKLRPFHPLLQSVRNLFSRDTLKLQHLMSMRFISLELWKIVIKLHKWLTDDISCYIYWIWLTILYICQKLMQLKFFIFISACRIFLVILHRHQHK